MSRVQTVCARRIPTDDIGRSATVDCDILDIRGILPAVIPAHALSPDPEPPPGVRLDLVSADDDAEPPSLESRRTPLPGDDDSVDSADSSPVTEGVSKETEIAGNGMVQAPHTLINDLGFCSFEVIKSLEPKHRDILQLFLGNAAHMWNMVVTLPCPSQFGFSIS